MPVPNYTKEEAAVHELGHAAVACAIQLNFTHVELILRASTDAWGGHCVPAATNETIPWIVLDAFLLGGPLIQKAQRPKSVGSHLETFEPSLFSNADKLRTEEGLFILDALLWGGDLLQSGMLWLAPKFPPMANWKMQFGEKPWLEKLEEKVRIFAEQDSTKAFINSAYEKLAGKRHLNAVEVKAAFAKHVAPEICADLVAFIDTYRAYPRGIADSFFQKKIIDG